jgi:hypothetical protein
MGASDAFYTIIIQGPKPNHVSNLEMKLVEVNVFGLVMIRDDAI